MHNIQNEKKQNTIPYPPASTLGLQGWMDHHAWFVQDWGSSPGHATASHSTNRGAAPAQTCVLYRVSLHNPGQPKTCYVDMMAGRELTNTWLLLPRVTPTAYRFCINLFAFFIVCNAVIICMLCREYYDLYILLCGNPSQTEVTSRHTEIHFQNVTIFQSIFWKIQSPPKEKNWGILPRNLTKAI